MAAADTKLGPWGEALAAAFLRKRGYHIVATNYRSRYGEIDIIAENAEYLVFAEVKLRRTAHFGAAREFVDLRKQERLRAAERHLTGVILQVLLPQIQLHRRIAMSINNVIFHKMHPQSAGGRDAWSAARPAHKFQ